MKIKAIDYVSYMVKDMKKSLDFYQNTLGLKLDSSGEGWAEFLVNDFAVVLVESGSGKTGAGMAIAVDDVQKSLNELKKKGVTVEGKAWETPVCHGSTIKDPDGNPIYLHKRNDGTCG